ncbi:MAG: TPM domain-containing protein [Bacteroidetes bacterium]|nr:TPM domain-containing protein [Bacteroidota bacterium]MBM3424383.1 TPM domain-containing protein [Bacteroidota bacterium]
MLSKEQKNTIVKTIQQAESFTSGEIRVYLNRTGSDSPMEKATKTFERLGMTRTQERNGVLIYLCFSRHQIAILGDQGINEKVPAGFWDDIYLLLAEHFKKGDFTEGICKAVLKIGENLSIFYPHREDDVNELSNDVLEE